jgi:hypothetical protein
VLAHDEVAIALAHDILRLGDLMAGLDEEQPRVLADRLVVAHGQTHDVVAVAVAAFADEPREVVPGAAPVDVLLEALVELAKGGLVARDALLTSRGHRRNLHGTRARRNPSALRRGLAG